MNKSVLKPFGFLAAGMLALALAGCGNGSSSVASSSSGSLSSASSSKSSAEDLTLVDHIKIVADSIVTSYQADDVVDYANLAIKTYNAHDAELDTYYYAQSAAAFTLGTIDTSKVGMGNFIVMFAASHPSATFSDSIAYTVVANQKKVVTQIRIANGFQTSYLKNEVPSYSDLRVKLENADGEVLSILTAKDNADTISYGAIDTSVVTTDGIFTVTYEDKVNGIGPFADSLAYTVSEVTHLTNWSASARWVAFENANKAVDDTLDGRETFMDSATFKLGTLNALSLCPVVKEYDAKTGNIVTFDSYMPEGVSFILKNSKGIVLDLDDYFSSDALTLLKSNGSIKFNDNVVAGAYSLTFRYGDGASESFPDIVYAFDLLRAYNITTAAQLMVCNTNVTTYATNDILDFKRANNLPESIMDQVIIQNNITIGADSIPTSFIWQTGEPVDSGNDGYPIVGTLKDWTYFYYHELNNGHPTFEVYGNLNKISLGNLPFIVSDAETSGSRNNGHNHDQTTPVEPHASLFFTFTDESLEGSERNDSDGAHRTLFQDIAVYGNQGVDGDSKWDNESGILFEKSFNWVVMKNINVNHFFTTVVNAGYAGYTSDASDPAVRDPNLRVIDSRMHDTYSTMIFNYDASATYCIHSELMNAGGPLVISQSSSFVSNPQPSSGDPNDLTRAAYGGTWFRADSSSHLENHVTGQGGWFALYNAESIITSLGTVSTSLFEPTFGVTFSPKEGNVTKYDFLTLNMGLSGSLAGNDPAFYGGSSLEGAISGDLSKYWDDDVTSWPTVVDGVNMIDYGDKADISTYMSGGLAAGVQNYDFMNTFLQQYVADGSARPAVFKTHGTGDSLALSDDQFMICTGSALYNSRHMVDGSAAADYGNFTNDERHNVVSSKYISIYYDTLQSDAVTDPTNYIGSSAYGIVMGLETHSAS